MNNNVCIIHGGYTYYPAYITRISGNAYSPSIEYPFERRNRAEFVWDSFIAWAIVPGAPKLTTTAPMVLPYRSSGIPVHAMPGHNPEIESDSLLILALVSLHSASSHTLLAAPSD
jgi:hypothetical protein